MEWSDVSDDSDVGPVSYGPVPDSPIQSVRYSRGNDSDSDLDIQSPQKKPRISKAKPNRRQISQLKKSTEATDMSNSVKVPERKAPEGRTADGWDNMDSAAEIEAHNWEGWDREAASEPAVSVDLVQVNGQERLYSSFVESLEWDDSMFTQMSDELFVVHGWNWRKNEATVRLLSICMFTEINLTDLFITAKFVSFKQVEKWTRGICDVPLCSISRDRKLLPCQVH
jgi:hypothetical protein